MTPSFFTAWETWEKLVFVLACTILITISLGCCKLVYLRWRLGKYAVLEEGKREQMLLRQISQRRRKAIDDVPFGIRALESGVRTEGVWVSRGNTPEIASGDTSLTPSLYDQPSQPLYEADMEKMSLQHSTLAPSPAKRKSSMVHQNLPSPARLSDLQDKSLKHDTPHPSLDNQIARPPRSRHPPISFSRCQSNPFVFQPQSFASSTLDALEAVHKASTSIHGDDPDESIRSSASSDSTGADVVPISASAPNLLTPYTKQGALGSFSSHNLDLLNDHRKSQAAETGQLTPRAQRAGKACRLDLTARPPRTTTLAERSDPFDAPPRHDSRRRRSSPPSKIDNLPLNVRRSSMPDVTPFTEFCRKAPSSPRPASLVKANNEPGDLTSAPPSPLIPASEGAEILKLPSPTRCSFQKEASKVVRGAGTGFEILQPGSLRPAMPGGSWSRLSSANLSASHRSSAAVDGRRKLWWTRRASANSRGGSGTMAWS